MDDVAQDAALAALAARLGAALEAAGWRVTVAESCTGGWVAKTLTDVAGASAWFDTGWVTYGNDAKTALLGVPPQTLAEAGAVSEETVTAMAAGALQRSGADLAVAISGIAGPDGGTEQKPVGTVWIAWARGKRVVDVRARCLRFDGDRDAVRRQAVAAALLGLLDSAEHGAS